MQDENFLLSILELGLHEIFVALRSKKFWNKKWKVLKISQYEFSLSLSLSMAVGS